MSFAIEGRIRRPFEASPVRSRTTYSSLNCLASGSKARSKKVMVKPKTCSYLRLLTGALPRIPNREVRETDPIQPLYAVHSELRSVTRAWSEIDHVTITNSLMESITEIAHCYDVHVTACLLGCNLSPFPIGLRIELSPRLRDVLSVQCSHQMPFWIGLMAGCRTEQGKYLAQHVFVLSRGGTTASFTAVDGQSASRINVVGGGPASVSASY